MESERMKLYKALMIVLMLSSGTVLAGEYILEKGKGVEVCDVYYEYLKIQKYPLTCKRNFPSNIKNLKRPDWKKLDNNKNKLLILRIENYLRIPKDEKATQPWVPVEKEVNFDKYNVNTPGRLLYTVNIDNNGKKEILVKYRSFLCHEYDTNKEPRWKAPIVVLDDEGSNLNIEKTYPLMQNVGKLYVTNVDEIIRRNKNFFQLRKDNMPYIERIKLIPVIKGKMKSTVYAAGLAKHQGYDVFEFKNERYFDKWDEERRGKSYQSLTIYKNMKSSISATCRYQYQR